MQKLFSKVRKYHKSIKLSGSRSDIGRISTATLEGSYPNIAHSIYQHIE